VVDVIRNKKWLLFKLKINRDLIIFFNRSSYYTSIWHRQEYCYNRL